MFGQQGPTADHGVWSDRRGKSQLDMWVGSVVTEGPREVTDQEVPSGHNPEAVRSTVRKIQDEKAFREGEAKQKSDLGMDSGNREEGESVHPTGQRNPGGKEKHRWPILEDHLIYWGLTVDQGWVFSASPQPSSCLYSNSIIVAEVTWVQS